MARVINHKSRAHAILSASSSKRWMNCTPSARLEERFGEKRDTAFSREGTTAHELAEKILLGKPYDADDDMLNYVRRYTDYCVERHNEGGYMVVEDRVDFSNVVPDGFGTADCIIIRDGVMEVIDLKYGKGVQVDAGRNPQLMLYAIGALNAYGELYGVKEVICTIVQPRLDHVSNYRLTVDELREFAVEVSEKAKLAYDGLGETTPGDWCQFCGIRNKCQALADYYMGLAKYEFLEFSLMTDDMVMEVITKAHGLAEWADSVKGYAVSEALRGKKWPGYKVVEGRSVRKWADPEKAGDAILERFDALTESDVFDMKIKGITELEKKIGKKAFTENTKDLIVKPAGNPTLVPDSDKRPSINASDEAAKEFENL